MKKSLGRSIQDFKTKHTTRELAMLVALLVFALYFLAVQLPISKISTKIDTRQAEVDAEIMDAEDKLAMMPVMLQAINQYKSSGDEYLTPKSDNTKGIIRGYHDIIGEVENYSLAFVDKKQEGKITRKYMTLSFTTNSYNDALNKIEALETNRNGFLISDCTISSASVGENAATKVWNVSLAITEFEYDE